VIHSTDRTIVGRIYETGGGSWVIMSSDTARMEEKERERERERKRTGR
jgi:hypothetical protein